MCDEGLHGERCDITCACSEHGRCLEDGFCECAHGRMGDTCDECVPGYFGPQCEAVCHYKEHCSAQGVCVSATGAAGAWIRTAEQTAAGAEEVFSVPIASMSAGQTRVPIVAAV